MIRIIGVSYDVTDSVARLQALRESEQRLSTAQAIAGIGTWSFEIPTGEIVWTSEVFSMYDIDRQGRSGPTFAEFLEKTAPSERAELLECIRHASEDGTPYVVHSTIAHRDGSVRRVRCNGGAVRDEDGVQLFALPVSPKTSRNRGCLNSDCGKAKSDMSWRWKAQAMGSFSSIGARGKSKYPRDCSIWLVDHTTTDG